ncbi:MAG: hypothetical protein RIM83_08710 [Allomuricauda sp.]|jgi:hypothetical protein|uniref:hypothetical protein n=1 Tax=Allomuricauda sp. CP2A TaxID=1848189 RepID=UPI000834168B|nr:hypothetical protein [Muricauda sp. CP2A]
MKKNVLFVFVLSLIGMISCKDKEGINVETLTYKESEMHKKLYLMNKIRSKTHKLKSFADEDREL